MLEELGLDVDASHHAYELVVDLDTSWMAHCIPSWLALLRMLEDLGLGVGVGLDVGASHHGCELVVDLDTF